MNNQKHPSNDDANGHEATLDAPVMDGATEVFNGDEDPRKGQSDPALIRHPEEGKKTANPFE